jgi:hypothetical protein
MWPAGLAERHGAIPEQQRLREGRALAVYGDAGWGQLVKAGKYGDDGVAGELVEAMVEMIGTDLAVPHAPHRVQHRVERRAAAGHGQVARVVVLQPAAHPERRGQAPAGQMIDRGELLGQHHRVAPVVDIDTVVISSIRSVRAAAPTATSGSRLSTRAGR